MGVSTSVAELRTKKSSFRDQFHIHKRNGKEDHHQCNVGRVIFEGAKKSILAGTPYEWTAQDEEKVEPKGGNMTLEEKFMQDLAGFSEGKRHSAIVALTVLFSAPSFEVTLDVFSFRVDQ